MEDVINEYDSDASGIRMTFSNILSHIYLLGQIDAQEFVLLMMARAKSPDDEMREAWSYFDADSDGEWQTNITHRHEPGSLLVVLSFNMVVSTRTNSKRAWYQHGRITGGINMVELKKGLERVGIRLAPWEVMCAWL